MVSILQILFPETKKCQFDTCQFKGSLVINKLIFVVILSISSISTAQFYCEGSKLHNQYGQIIKEFTFNSDCKRSVEKFKGYFICAEDTSNTVLLNFYGQPMASFTFGSDCIKAIETVDTGFICYNKDSKVILKNVYTLFDIFSFTFTSDCKSALEQAPTGYICASQLAGYQLVDTWSGRNLKSFTFKSECESAKEILLLR